MAVDQWSTSSGIRTQRRLGRLFASSADTRIIADARDGRVVFWNPAAQSLFGYSAGEVSELTLPTLVGEEQRARLGAFLARYEATGRLPIIDGDGRAEFLALRKTGEDVVVELTLSPLDGSPGEGRLVLASMRDVSGRLLRERELTSGRARDRRIDERDELTNLPDRAAFDRQLAQQIERSRRRRQSFALLLLDVDRFD